MKKKSQAQLARQLFAASDNYLSCCCPLLMPDEYGHPTVFASAILISIAESHFVITAAHVLDEAAKSMLYLPAEKVLVELRGPGAITIAPAQGGREADKNDSGFVMINPGDAEKIKTCFTFLPIDLIDNSDSLVPGRTYRFSGYPWKPQRVDHQTRSVIPQLYTFLAKPLTGITYGKWGFNEAFHIMVRFSENKVRDPDGKRVHSPDPHGMSGGAVFGITTSTSLQGAVSTCVRLAGIAIEVETEDRLLAGVRLTGVLERIRRTYPDLSKFIPESTTIEIVHGIGNSSP